MLSTLNLQIAHLGDQYILGPNAARVDKYRWFENLNKFFDYFEKYNLKSYNCGSSKVNHRKTRRFYNQRKVIQNKTKELILMQNVFFLKDQLQLII